MKNNAYSNRVLNQRNRDNSTAIASSHTSSQASQQALIYLHVSYTVKRETSTIGLACRENLFPTGLVRGTEWPEQKCVHWASRQKSKGVCSSHVDRSPIVTDPSLVLMCIRRAQPWNPAFMATYKWFLGWKKNKFTQEILTPTYLKSSNHL